MLTCEDVGSAKHSLRLRWRVRARARFAERVIRNLINDPSYCKPCGLYCDNCKHGTQSYIHSISTATQLPKPSRLPSVIEGPENYLPKNLPRADVYIASGLHRDILLALPQALSRAGAKALIAPIEYSQEVPPGLRRQIQQVCREWGVEAAFPKPFCTLHPSSEQPIITRLTTELGIGRPRLSCSHKARRM